MKREREYVLWKSLLYRVIHGDEHAVGNSAWSPRQICYKSPGLSHLPLKFIMTGAIRHSRAPRVFAPYIISAKDPGLQLALADQRTIMSAYMGAKLADFLTVYVDSFINIMYEYRNQTPVVIILWHILLMAPTDVVRKHARRLYERLKDLAEHNQKVHDIDPNFWFRVRDVWKQVYPRTTQSRNFISKQLSGTQIIPQVSPATVWTIRHLILFGHTFTLPKRPARIRWHSPRGTTPHLFVNERLVTRQEDHVTRIDYTTTGLITTFHAVWGEVALVPLKEMNEFRADRLDEPLFSFEYDSLPSPDNIRRMLDISLLPLSNPPSAV